MTEWKIEEKRVVLTGGNCGIGLATAKELCRRGAEVHITARDEAKGRAAVAEIEEEVPGAKITCHLLDLAQRASIRNFAELIQEQLASIDVLIHNAGLILSQRQELEGGVEATFGINHLGPFLLTELLLPKLRQSAPARIVVVASFAHNRARGLDFDDLQSKRNYHGVAVYSASKLANILFTRELAGRLEGSGVTANCLHPGVVATRFAADGDADGLWGFVFKYLRFLLLTPERGARTSVFLASDQSLDGQNGGYYSGCRLAKPSRAASDDLAAKKLWAASRELLGL
ncbi:MAG: retinol dehydrogenase-12 [Planctomycetota bacterium]|jgi:retinol dehydrogenase-12